MLAHLGWTRSRLAPDHLLQTPDTFIRTPMPGLVRGVAVVHASPVVGAEFTMSTLELEAEGSLAAGPLQRFVYVLEGTMGLGGAVMASTLEAGNFFYLPAASETTLYSTAGTRFLLIEKPYEPLPDLPGPDAFIGSEALTSSTPLNGDPDLQVCALLPADARFDFAVNTMTYAPGASLGQVEIHYMEHGLVMLQGEGIYRLGDRWYPVHAGDVIWMAPFCPQWFGALGKTPAKYLIYKNFNRHTRGGRYP